MKINITLSLVFVLSLIFGSCFRNSEGGGSMLPNVGGSTGEVVVVIDKARWDGSLGEKIREVFSSSVDGLPQSEPMFNITNVAPSAFGSIYMTHRNVIFIDIGPDKAEPKATSKTNTYANTQLMINLEGPDDNSIIRLLEKEKKSITDKINIAERDRWISYYKRSINTPTFSNLRDNHKMVLYVPANYKMDVNEKGFLWFSYETPMTTQAILVHYFDYNGENYFNEDSIRAIRNNMTRTRIKGPVDGTWMKIEDQIPVQYRTFRFRNRNYAELKGLWTLENGYMGGPFVCLVTKDEVNNRFVMIDGFVYAPHDNKRELVRQIEAILYTVDFNTGSDETKPEK